MAGAGFSNYLNNLKDLSVPVWREIKETILDYKPTVVGITTKTQNFKSVCIVAGLAKEINKQIVVVIGGPHPSMVGGDALKHKDIDVCVRGEGEKTIVELLNAIAVQKELEGIRGIVYRKNGRIFENAPREYIEDLDSLCFPHERAPEVLKDYKNIREMRLSIFLQ